jgi:TonB family protein
VDVFLLVEADGSVAHAEVGRSSGHDVLDRAAVEVARASRFSPPAAVGLRPPARGYIEYRFVLSGTP